jgi:hypothetical protein
MTAFKLTVKIVRDDFFTQPTEYFKTPDTAKERVMELFNEYNEANKGMLTLEENNTTGVYYMRANTNGQRMFEMAITMITLK